ncbi:transcription factor Ouib-like [Drosophila busckii]|uniref:transcription factor Ouib-like n=1 Tax=Drosophila busckii TaxID=30019 RepID=UPI00083EB40F|nr:transcription factor Ouib-like [Drosophila busckii]
MSIQCRTCGEPIYDQDPRNLFEPEHKNIRDNIEALTSIKLANGPQFPKHICSCCYLDLDYSISFRERCLETQKHLLNIQPNTNYAIDLNCVYMLQSKDKDAIDKDENESLETLDDNLALQKDSEHQTNATIHSNPIKDIPIIRGAKSIAKYKKSKDKVKKYLSPDEKKYICDYCGWTFRDLSNMKDHVIRHSGVKDFECKQCGAKFFTRPQLMLHDRVHHKGEKPFKCKYCNMGFRNSPGRCRHERKYHPNELPFACNLCKRTFISKISLENHKIVHITGETVYSCNACLKIFKDAISLKRHNLTKYHLRRTMQMLEFETFTDEELEYDFVDSIVETTHD